MADLHTDGVNETTAGCGCCQEEPQTADMRVQKLLDQRQRIERSLSNLQREGALAGVTR